MVYEGKLHLKICLDNIANGIDIEESVETAVGVLGSYSASADNVLLLMGDRAGGEWLQKDLEDMDITNVGLYGHCVHIA